MGEFDRSLQAWAQKQIDRLFVARRRRLALDVRRLIDYPHAIDGIIPLPRGLLPGLLGVALRPVKEGDQPETISIEHGLLVVNVGGLAHIELIAALQNYYAGPGDPICDGTTDHLFGFASVGAQCTGSSGVYALLWGDATPTGTNHVPVATADETTEWVGAASLSPGAHSGIARWVAQARQALASIADLAPKSWPAYDPRYYTVARLLDPGASLAYWLVYAGPSGVYGCRLQVSSALDSCIAAVRDGEVDGQALSEEETRRYESVIFRALRTTSDTVVLSADGEPFDGAEQIAHGVKWSDDGLAGRIVTVAGSGDSAIATRWHLSLTTAEVGGVLRIDSSAWTIEESGAYNPRSAFTSLYVCLGGVTVPVMSATGGDSGSGVAAYEMSYSSDPLRYSKTGTGPAATPSNEIYPPGIYGEGGASRSYVLGATSHVVGGYYVGPLSMAESYTSKTSLDLTLKTLITDQVLEKAGGQTVINSRWFPGMPDVSQWQLVVRTWHRGSIRCDEYEVTGGNGSRITAVIVPESDAEALYLCEYEEADEKETRHWYDGTSPVALKLMCVTLEDKCVDNDGGPCPSQLTGFDGDIWQERIGWYYRDPSWIGPDGRITFVHTRYGISGPHHPSCSASLCSSVHGRYYTGSAVGSIKSGLAERVGTTETSSEEDVKSARSWLLTRHGPIELSSDTAAWSAPLLGVPSSAPVAIASAGGDSIIFQDSSAGAIQTTGDEDISGATLMRHVGAV